MSAQYRSYFGVGVISPNKKRRGVTGEFRMIVSRRNLDAIHADERKITLFFQEGRDLRRAHPRRFRRPAAGCECGIEAIDSER